MRGLFVAGTDTGVGKTYVACLIVRALRAAGVSVGAYKPVCSGSRPGPDGQPVWDDVERLAAALGEPVDRARVCPQCFHAPVAPPEAAALEGRAVDSPLLIGGADWWRTRVEVLVVEGAGGLLSPIARDRLVADVAADFGMPLIVVAADRLGVINHTLLTLETALHRGLSVAGVVLNRPYAAGDASTDSNHRELTRLCPAPVIARCGYGSNVLHAAGTADTVDWHRLAAGTP